MTRAILSRLAWLAWLAASAPLVLGACTGPARISLGAASSTTAPDGGTDASVSSDGATDASDETPDASPLPTFYLSPTGDDGNPGTRARPWRSFRHALPQLHPGYTLILLDGTYDGGTSGYFKAGCGDTRTGAFDGTPGAHITVRAENSRRAFLRGDASGPPFYMEGCGYWDIDGLRIESADLKEAPDTPDAGSVVFLGPGNHDIILRHLLASHPNRYKHSHVIRVGDGSRHILVEESEVYDFHHNAFEATRSDFVIFRRNYVNARTLFAMDLAGGYGSLDPARGDYGFLLEETRLAIVENNVVENTYAGIGVVGRNVVYTDDQPPPVDDPLDGNRLLGNVINQAATFGIRLESRCNSIVPCLPARAVLNTDLTDDVILGSALGVSSTGATNTRITKLTVIGADSGVVLAKESQNAGLTSTSMVVNSLVVDFHAAGFRADGEDQWWFGHDASVPAAGASGAAYVPDDAQVDGRVTVAPRLGGCLVYLPPTSPLRGAGVGPADVGANVVNRYEDGVLTTKPLWTPGVGFPCGATIESVNDDLTTSCGGVNARLHVGAQGCAFP